LLVARLQAAPGTHVDKLTDYLLSTDPENLRLEHQGYRFIPIRPAEVGASADPAALDACVEIYGSLRLTTRVIGYELVHACLEECIALESPF
jgi:hypothetical protein